MTFTPQSCSANAAVAYLTFLKPHFYPIIYPRALSSPEGEELLQNAAKLLLYKLHLCTYFFMGMARVYQCVCNPYTHIDTDTDAHTVS